MGFGTQDRVSKVYADRTRVWARSPPMNRGALTIGAPTVRAQVTLLLVLGLWSDAVVARIPNSVRAQRGPSAPWAYYNA